MLDGWGGCQEPWDDVEGDYAPGAFGNSFNENNENYEINQQQNSYKNNNNNKIQHYYKKLSWWEKLEYEKSAF